MDIPLLHPDHTLQFITSIQWIDLGIFMVSLGIIVFSTHSFRKISWWLSKKNPTHRMKILGWIPIINFLLYFFGTVGSFYIIFKPNQKFLIAFIISNVVLIGLALKDVVTSFIGGIILLIDKPFQVGDRITYQDHYGEIQKIGLRSVKLLTLDESIVTIPNQRFISDAVSSSSAGALGMMVTVDLYVPEYVNLHQIKSILNQEALKSPHRMDQSKIIIVMKQIIGINGIISFLITVKCILKDARLEKVFQTDFLMSVHLEFKKNHIKMSEST